MGDSECFMSNLYFATYFTGRCNVITIHHWIIVILTIILMTWGYFAIVKPAYKITKPAMEYVESFEEWTESLECVQVLKERYDD